MVNRKETTIEERKLVIKLSNEGKSLRNIAKVVGRNVNCIQKILQKFKKTGMLTNTEGRGRKKIMNSITETRVIHQVKIDPKISALKIAASTSNTLGRSVSAETLMNSPVVWFYSWANCDCADVSMYESDFEHELGGSLGVLAGQVTRVPPGSDPGL
ncbi:HTH_Tnp_Tc3_2 domain-containing protein [Trichonephila clavata]|uniref:HTH_Tnp_Tc3_2 domain-containing protein n=1 Tax=Trichonephila clavata TaxID=2740835 RepID=A0A8X6FB12_TRICU|nr:HTH_Tnp_Tc3_2 domain-containing protein [Trichonephila clavata]